MGNSFSDEDNNITIQKMYETHTRLYINFKSDKREADIVVDKRSGKISVDSPRIERKIKEYLDKNPILRQSQGNKKG